MRLWMIRLRRWRNTEVGSTVLACVRLMPWVLVVGGMKMYIIMLLVHTSGRLNQDNRLDYADDDESSLQVPPDQHMKSEEYSDLQEKYRILSILNETSILPSAKNRTPEDTIWLFFNRVPRTGGQTLVALLKYISDDLTFQHQEHIYRTPWQRLMTNEEQKNLATWFEYNVWPRSYDRFALYINFTKVRSSYEKKSPAYISLVRDPVEKFISHYRYKRYDTERVKLEMSLRERKQPGLGRRWYWKKLESCVLDDDPECSLDIGMEDYNSAIPFLCGQHPQCLVLGDRWALQQAMFNAEFEYSVIGVTEHWNVTMAVLQEYLPMFFGGALQRYWSEDFTERQKNKSPKKHIPVSKQVIELLKSKLALEYELYEFLLQRIYKQYHHISDNLKNTTPLPARTSTIREFNAWERLEMQIINKSKS